jgi:hypothetical protein
MFKHHHGLLVMCSEQSDTRNMCEQLCVLSVVVHVTDSSVACILQSPAADSARVNLLLVGTNSSECSVRSLRTVPLALRILSVLMKAALSAKNNSTTKVMS